MKFSFTQSAISRGLQRVIGAVSSKVPMPSLSNVHLKLDGQMLSMTSTDLEVTITATVDLIDSEGQGGALVHAKRFQEIVNALPDIPLEMEIQEPFKVFLRGEGLGIYQLPGGDPIDFPDLPKVDPKVSIKIPCETLKRMISKTIFAVSKDEMRPVLTGILLQIRPGELRFVSTDGHRLSKISREDGSQNIDARDDIIPMKALNVLLKNLGDDEDVEINLSETRASFTSPGQRLITRLIDGHYPKYESVIPKDNPNKLILRLSDFMSTLRRVSIFSSSISHQIKLSIDSNKVKIEAEDPEYGGRAQEELAVDYEGDPLDIAYNAVYLSESLRQIDTDEAVVSLLNANDAAIIKPIIQKEGEDFLMLLMPIRLR